MPPELDAWAERHRVLPVAQQETASPVPRRTFRRSGNPLDFPGHKSYKAQTPPFPLKAQVPLFHHYLEATCPTMVCQGRRSFTLSPSKCYPQGRYKINRKLKTGVHSG